MRTYIDTLRALQFGEVAEELTDALQKLTLTGLPMVDGEAV